MFRLLRDKYGFLNQSGSPFIALFFSYFCLIPFRAVAQIPPNNTIDTDRQEVPPQDIAPPNPIPSLPTTPSSPAPPEELLPSPKTPKQPPGDTTEETITVTEFSFTGNTAFSNAELAPLVANLTERSLPLSQLLQIADDVAQLYAEKGYATSGAVISIPQATRQQRQGNVEIQIIEGELEEIQIFNSPPPPPPQKFFASEAKLYSRSLAVSYWQTFKHQPSARSPSTITNQSSDRSRFSNSGC